MVGYLGMAAAIAWALSPGDAVAQQATTLRHACQSDYARLCTGDDPPSGLMRACLAQYYVNLAPPCQAALDAARAAANGDAGGGAGQ